MSGKGKVDSKIVQERVHEISLLLKRKPLKYIIEYMIKTWGIEKAQAYKYINKARKEWERYFKNLKRAGMGYHISQMRELKDQALEEEDTRLVLDIDKEEAKLMGIYPSEKHKIEVEEVGKVANAKGKLIKRINDLIDKRRKGKDIK